MTDAWPFKGRKGVRSRGRSRWNILPGTGAAGACHADGNHSRSWDIFPGAGVIATKKFPSRIHTKDAGPESEP